MVATLTAALDAADDMIEAVERRRACLMAVQESVAHLRELDLEPEVQIDRDDGVELVTIFVDLGRPLEIEKPVVALPPPEAEQAAPEIVLEEASPLAEDGVDDTVAPTAVDGTAERKAGMERRGGPLSDDEKRQVLALHDAGKHARLIADALGRPRKGFHLIVRNTLKARERACSEKPAPHEDADPPKREAPVSIPVVEKTRANYAPAPPFGSSVGGEERDTLERLGKLPVSSNWSHGDDAALVRRLTQGEKPGRIATDLGVDRKWLRDRFHAICPEPTPEGQALAIRLLNQLARGSSV